MSYIYLTTNLVNGKKYIGKLQQHSKSSTTYLGSGVLLKKAIAKYGKENFKKEIIVEGNFNANLLNELEKHHIQLHAAVIKDDYYNISNGGNEDLRIGVTNSINNRKQKVYQYDINGNLIQIFECAKEVFEKLNVKATTLHRSIQYNSCNRKLNCYFTTNKNEIKPRTVKPVANSNACIVYTLTGKKVKEYVSNIQCGKDLNITSGYVRYLCINKIPFENYYIRYANDNSDDFMTIPKRSNLNGVALYNDNECLIFESQSEADRTLNLTKGTIRRLLKRKKSFIEYNIRTIWTTDLKISNIGLKKKGENKHIEL